MSTYTVTFFGRRDEELLRHTVVAGTVSEVHTQTPWQVASFRIEYEGDPPLPLYRSPFPNPYHCRLGWSWVGSEELHNMGRHHCDPDRDVFFFGPENASSHTDPTASEPPPPTHKVPFTAALTRAARELADIAAEACCEPQHFHANRGTVQQRLSQAVAKVRYVLRGETPFLR